MIRKLLACLALLTGLAAAGMPAQAEVASALANRIEASVRADSPVSAPAYRALVVADRFAPVMLADARPLRPVVNPAPAVALRIDRARE